MSVVETCNCKKNIDKFILLQQIRSTLSDKIEKKIFLKNYRQWFQKILSFKSIAFILYDSRKSLHIIYDVFPAGFQNVINQQLEDGIIFWAGQNNKTFVSDQKIFVPLHVNQSYIGIIEIIPKKKFDVLDKEIKILFEIVGDFIADYFYRINDKQNIPENILHHELVHLALLGAISNGLIHEISNPLTTIIGRAGLLLNNQEKLNSNLEIIEKETARVSGSIHEFLAISRNRFGKELDQNIQLNKIIKKSTSLLDYYARKKQIEIILNLDPHISNISTNYFSLLSFFTQLLFFNFVQLNQSQTIQISTFQNEENVNIVIDSNNQENSFYNMFDTDYSICQKEGKTIIQFPVLVEACQN